eukprot:EG_transcript_32460
MLRAALLATGRRLDTGGQRASAAVGLAVLCVVPLEVAARYRTGKWLWDYWLRGEPPLRDTVGLTTPKLLEYVHRVEVFQQEQQQRVYWQQVAQLGFQDTTMPTVRPP